MPAIVSFSTDSGTIGDGITNDNTLALTGTAEANSTVKVYDGATLLGTAKANASGAWSLTTSVLVDGTHNFTAVDTDLAGNISAPSAVLKITVDTIAPGLAITMDHLTANTVQLAGTSDANSLISIYNAAGGQLLGTTTAAANGTWSFQSVGTTVHNVKVVATDQAGNTHSWSDLLRHQDLPIVVAVQNADELTNSGGTLVSGHSDTGQNDILLTDPALTNSGGALRLEAF